ncbi:MAG: hypothetical protein LHW56_08600 [Candidatus Cloacimonetes bacterium]|nr:hypothetical protein [Candidatus Cloacimonadota bacterium]MDY0172953.1 hypothetical protein [Candidatus Cloacimonadaceae bacterium]
MESLFIVLLEGRVCVFESVDDQFDSVSIKGEECTQLKTNQADWCIRELLGNLGVDDLQDWSVSVIYDCVTSELLSPVLVGLLPHKPFGLEVRSLESLMPELLLRCKMISPGQTVTVGLGTRCWQVTLTQEGRVTKIECMEGVVPNERLSECDIPGALRDDYAFTANHIELDNLLNQLNTMTNQYTEITQQMEELQKNIHYKELMNQLYVLNLNQKEEIINNYELAINELVRLLIPMKPSNIINNVFGARIIYDDSSSSLPEMLKLVSSTKSGIITEKLYSQMKLVYGNLLKNETIQYFLNNINCSEKILIELAHHNDFDVRKKVAKHQNCPSDLLKLLINDKRKEVRDIAQSRI